MISNTTRIAITEARDHVARFIEQHPEATVEDLLRCAFRVTRNHWMETSEDGRFRAGVGAVILNVGREEQERINRELRALQSLSAAMSGVPIDPGPLVELAGEPAPIGLLNIWREAQHG